MLTKIFPDVLKKLLPQWNILPANEIRTGFRLTDRMIWEFAKANQYTIITFDEDFIELQNLFSYPPKIIWVRAGNTKTAQIAVMLLYYNESIANFLNDPESGVYEIR